MSRPFFSSGKKLTGGKFRPVTPEMWFWFHTMVQNDFCLSLSVCIYQFTHMPKVLCSNLSVMLGGFPVFLG